MDAMVAMWAVFSVCGRESQAVADALMAALLTRLTQLSAHLQPAT
jgi:hypothetical protein